MESETEIEEIEILDHDFPENNLTSQPSIQNILHNNYYLIPSDLAIRLYQSSKAYDHERGIFSGPSLQDEQDSEANLPICRICRYGTESEELIPCPCRCTGSIGHVHFMCLQRWARWNHSNICELCRYPYDTEVFKRNYKLLLLRFFQLKYFGVLILNTVNVISVTPLVYLTVNQVIDMIESSNNRPIFNLVVIAPTLLVSTSIYFFLYFEWTLSCILHMKSALMHWWHYGDTENNEYPEIPSFDDFQGLFEII